MITLTKLFGSKPQVHSGRINNLVVLSAEQSQLVAAGNSESKTKDTPTDKPTTTTTTSSGTTSDTTPTSGGRPPFN